MLQGRGVPSRSYWGCCWQVMLQGRGVSSRSYWGCCWQVMLQGRGVSSRSYWGDVVGRSCYRVGVSSRSYWGCCWQVGGSPVGHTGGVLTSWWCCRVLKWPIHAKKPSYRRSYRGAGFFCFFLFCFVFFFARYTAAMAKNLPDCTPGLMSHLTTVLKAYAEVEEPAWWEYDEAFREKRASTGERSWSGMDVSLYQVLCGSRPRRRSTAP